MSAALGKSLFGRLSQKLHRDFLQNGNDNNFSVAFSAVANSEAGLCNLQRIVYGTMNYAELQKSLQIRPPTQVIRCSRLLRRHKQGGSRHWKKLGVRYAGLQLLGRTGLVGGTWSFGAHCIGILLPILCSVRCVSRSVGHFSFSLFFSLFLREM